MTLIKSSINIQGVTVRLKPYNCILFRDVWETDFYTPPVLGGAALLENSAPAVYKIPVP